jgi:hypothetical protein
VAVDVAFCFSGGAVAAGLEYGSACASAELREEAASHARSIEAGLYFRLSVSSAGISMYYVHLTPLPDSEGLHFS